MYVRLLLPNYWKDLHSAVYMFMLANFLFIVVNDSLWIFTICFFLTFFFLPIFLYIINVVLLFVKFAIVFLKKCAKKFLYDNHRHCISISGCVSHTSIITFFYAHRSPNWWYVGLCLSICQFVSLTFYIYKV